MPEATPAPQAELPLQGVRRFVIPDDPEVVAGSTGTTKAVETKEVTPAAPVQKTEQNIGESATPAKEGETPQEVKAEETLTPEQAEERDRKKEGRRFGRRLDKAYRERAEAQARADFLEKQVNELRQSAPPQKVEGEPTLAQFDYDPEKYATAKAEFAKSQALKELEAKQREQVSQSFQTELVSKWEEKVDKSLDKYDDYQEVVGELKPVSPLIVAIMDAENGPDIAYYLGKHLDEAKRLAALPHVSQIREIGRLEAKLSLAPAKPITPSKAPPPITPVTGAASTATDVPSDDDDLKTWMRKRQKQVHGKRFG